MTTATRGLLELRGALASLELTAEESQLWLANIESVAALLIDHRGHASRSLALRSLVWNAFVAVRESEGLSPEVFGRALRAILAAVPSVIELQPNWSAAAAWSNRDELHAFVLIALGREDNILIADVPDAAERVADFARQGWGTPEDPGR